MIDIPSVYVELLKNSETVYQMDTTGIPDDNQETYQRYPQDRLGKDRSGIKHRRIYYEVYTQRRWLNNYALYQGRMAEV